MSERDLEPMPLGEMERIASDLETAAQVCWRWALTEVGYNRMLKAEQSQNLAMNARLYRERVAFVRSPTP